MKLQTLIVDDSAFMRLLLSDVLSSDPGLDVIGTAKDGLEAVKMTKKHRPDVIVMDMEMGEYNGLYAIKHIMEQCPTPIMILSSVGNTNLEPIFDALRLGAVDYMNKPVRGGSKIRTMDQELISRLKGINKARPQIVKNNQQVQNTAPKKKKKSSDRFEILIIGASTGGPSAVEQIIISLQDEIDVPIVICQHMPPNFIDPFVRRINSRTPLNVMLGTPGMEPRKGNVIICPGDANLELKRRGKSGKVQLVASEKTFKEYNNPSINAIMLSAAAVYKDASLGVLLTGMGKDGAKGMKAIGESGGLTVAQDEASSVIFGMPKAAIEAGKVDQVLDIKEIGTYLISVT
ncbi:MAG: chemotaxis-specific protein-glutamate methyltransferase CheB [Cytophagales bacterium]|nr:chemotaxis-specific protein-glutamate methyltransferase CheB [Cytophagales bacterium]